MRSALRYRPRGTRSAPAPTHSPDPSRRGYRLERLRRSKRGHRPAPALVVDEVDGLVLAIGAGDPEQHREPADRAETTLLGKGPPEDELVSDAVEVAAGLLPHAVHVHLVTISRPCGQLDARVGLHVS